MAVSITFHQPVIHSIGREDASILVQASEEAQVKLVMGHP
jgi:hypothetical protein